jgi:hypothetical protein
MQNFNIYEKYNLEQIIQIFESIFKIGFDFMLKFDFVKYFFIPKNEFYHYKFTQLASCMGQNYINSSIIDYLITKFTDIYGYAKAQQELVESLKHCLMFYQLSRRLKLEYLNEILEFILPNLNETDFLYFMKIFTKSKKIFTSSFAICYFAEYNGYWFYTKKFKTLDYFYNYEILDLDDSLNIIACLVDNIYTSAYFQSKYLDMVRSLKRCFVFI